MISVKYKCNKCGVFTVQFDLGGRGRVGRSPNTQPCPTCKEECRRAHRPGISVSKRLFERMQVYCEASLARGRPMSMSELIAKATKGIGE